jgi:hypothetical protein
VSGNQSLPEDDQDPPEDDSSSGGLTFKRLLSWFILSAIFGAGLYLARHGLP